MFIDFSPSLTDEVAEALEMDLGSIADVLGIEGVDVGMSLSEVETAAENSPV